MQPCVAAGMRFLLRRWQNLKPIFRHWFTNFRDIFCRFVSDDPTNTARGTPVAFVTTEQRKAGLIPDANRAAARVYRCRAAGAGQKARQGLMPYLRPSRAFLSSLTSC